MKKFLLNLFIITFLPLSLLSAATLKDGMGHDVVIPENPQRIICLNSGLSALLGALGVANSVVARDSNSTFPHSLLSSYVVASNSSSPNVELILERNPDLILADNMFPKDVYAQLTSLGIPVAIYRTSSLKSFNTTISGVSQLVGKQKRGEYLLGQIESKNQFIQTLVAQAQKDGYRAPKVFFENRKPYSSASQKSGSHTPLALAGGINIAANEPVSSPKLSVEFIMEENPDVIIRRLSGDGSQQVMANMQNSIKKRIGLKQTKAVKTNRVYIMKADLTLLLRFPSGVAYMAKWFYPEALKDFSPQTFDRALIKDFFGAKELDYLHETLVYPDE